MNDDIFTLKKTLADSLRRAAAQAGAPDAAVTLESPPDRTLGDLATPVALALAKTLKKPPIAIAREIAAKFEKDPALVSDVSVASPGFINLRLNPKVLHGGLLFALRSGAGFGKNAEASGQKVLLEFVSANPTGPLNIVSARAAALGDSMARLLRASGATVTSEYFVNDAGVQSRLFGESLLAACRRVKGITAETPEGGYSGSYMEDLAREFLADPEWSSRWESAGGNLPPSELGSAGMRKVIGWHQASLANYDVSFDNWYSEKKELHETGKITRCVDSLKEKNLTFEQDGALWLRVSAFGAPKDEVLIKRDGNPAYFAPDIAYHVDKFARGFNRLVDIMGPDHHGHIQRMMSAMTAAGQPAERLSILIAQQVNLLHEGEKFKMSKREGRFITMDELVEEVGKDAARFFFNMRSASAHLDFDLEVAKKQTDENPVFYVQYAHARICSLLRKAREAGVEPDREGDLVGKLLNPEELLLLKEIMEYPEWVSSSAKALEPHRIVTYLMALAGDFHVFYDRHRIIGALDGLDRARTTLAEGVRWVLHNALELLGVSAPERM